MQACELGTPLRDASANHCSMSAQTSAPVSGSPVCHRGDPPPRPGREPSCALRRTPLHQFKLLTSFACTLICAQVIITYVEMAIIAALACASKRLSLPVAQLASASRMSEPLLPAEFSRTTVPHPANPLADLCGSIPRVSFHSSTMSGTNPKKVRAP